MSAKQLFLNMVKSHVEQPLNVQDLTVKIIDKIAPNSHQIEILKNQDSWRQFMPPLYNLIITCIEVFLEQYFLEQYRKPNGEKYESRYDWINDINEFKARYTWPNRKIKNNISHTFSFQKLTVVDVLYSLSLNKSISRYSKYDLIKFLFARRHLFTHRGGLIDQKFIDEYNSYHSDNENSKILDGQFDNIATINRNVLIASIEEAKQFINYTDTN